MLNYQDKLKSIHSTINEIRNDIESIKGVSLA